MIIIVKDNREVAKFEKWEANKALDYITQKGWYVTGRLHMSNSTTWLCKTLP